MTTASDERLDRFFAFLGPVFALAALATTGVVIWAIIRIVLWLVSK